MTFSFITCMLKLVRSSFFSGLQIRCLNFHYELSKKCMNYSTYFICFLHKGGRPRPRPRPKPTGKQNISLVFFASLWKVHLWRTDRVFLCVTAKQVDSKTSSNYFSCFCILFILFCSQILESLFMLFCRAKTAPGFKTEYVDSEISSNIFFHS